VEIMPAQTWVYGGLAVTAIARLWALRRWAMTWGMSRPELRRAWPGDDVSPHPMDIATRGITIRAPMQTVWSWLVQIGQDRAGFYSYRWLENLFRCAIIFGMPDQTLSIRHDSVASARPYVRRRAPRPFVVFRACAAFTANSTRY
jgi:hypothetical protein